LAFCDTQYKESVRLLGTVDLFQGWWEHTYSYRRTGPPPAEGEPAPRTINGPLFAYSFQPVATFFYDDATNAPTDPSTFTRIDGAVAGVQARLGGAISPRPLDYRLVLRGSYALTEAFDRDSGRRSTFPASSHLLTVSLDYEFGVRSFA